MKEIKNLGDIFLEFNKAFRQMFIEEISEQERSNKPTFLKEIDSLHSLVVKQIGIFRTEKLPDTIIFGWTKNTVEEILTLMDNYGDTYIPPEKKFKQVKDSIKTAQIIRHVPLGHVVVEYPNN